MTAKSKVKTNPCVKELAERFFHVDGVLFWKSKWGRMSAGKKAGKIHLSTGYVVVRLKGKELLGHRVIWALENNEWPPTALDHISGDRTDNRIENLRLCDSIQNGQNRAVNKSSKTGFKGVRQCIKNSKFHSLIKVNGKQIYLGTFDDAISAAIAYNKACAKFYGDFARPNEIIKSGAAA
jgi:hypothetical protein